MQKRVKVPTAVKIAIFEAIKEESSSIVTCSSSEHGDNDRAHGGWVCFLFSFYFHKKIQLYYVCAV